MRQGGDNNLRSQSVFSPDNGLDLVPLGAPISQLAINNGERLLTTAILSNDEDTG